MLQSPSKVGGNSEFGVENQVFYCELDYVGDTLSRSVVFGKQFEVINRIVSPVSVFVMDGFLLAKWATEVLFHYVAVLKHVSRRVSVFAGNYEAHVAVFHKAARDGVVRVLLLVGYSAKQRSAFSAAQVFAAVDSSPRAALDNHAVSALNTDVVPSFFGETPADSTTFGGAVQRQFAPFLLVGANASRFHGERRVANLARKNGWGDLSCWPAVFGFVKCFAGEAAKKASVRVRRSHAERLFALFTDYLSRHFGFSLVGGYAHTSVARMLVQVNRRT
jgi:hypothetical protein